MRYWIDKLNLQPHPEGGYYREVYRSAEYIPQSGLPERYEKAHVFATSIFFLLPGTDFSALHRLRSDEIWHFYAGSALTITMIDQEGNLEQTVLGNNPEKGESLQAVIPHGVWFGARVNDAEGFALAGCTVAPGFEFEDFELGNRRKLLAEFPQHSEIIKRLTRS